MRGFIYSILVALASRLEDVHEDNLVMDEIESAEYLDDLEEEFVIQYN